MSVQTDAQLTTAATVIQAETVAGSNTAARVGGLLNNIIENKPNITIVPVTVKVSISSAEILALFTTPKTIVAAPGAGKLIRPICYTIVYNYGAAAYSANNFLFQIGSITPLGTVALNGVAGDSVLMIAPPLNTIITAADDWTNAALILKCQSANPTVGDGSLDVYTTYQIITL